VRKSQLRGLTAGALFSVSVIVIPLATAGSAAASTSIPASPQTCSAGEPKLDYGWAEVVQGVQSSTVWSDVCGFAIWDWDASGGGGINLIIKVRMPTTPTYRIWLHNSAGDAWCAYSEDSDISVPAAFDTPVNVQVSGNSSPC
jgi:hypothetical protein